MLADVSRELGLLEPQRNVLAINRKFYDPCMLSALTHEIHVWLGDPCLLIPSNDMTIFVAQLDQAEKDRYHRFLFEKDRHHFLAAHVLVRMALSHYVDLPLDHWRFTSNEFGRPEIVGTTDTLPLRFNLSHTRGLVVCVVTHDMDCGIDAEHIRPLPSYLAIARRMFTEREYDYMTGVAQDQQYETFFKIWTLKEAYIKARGMGLSLDMATFEFSIVSDNTIELSASDHLPHAQDLWQFQVMHPTPEHIVALAVRSSIASAWRVVRQKWLAGKVLI